MCDDRNILFNHDGMLLSKLGEIIPPSFSDRMCQGETWSLADAQFTPLHAPTTTIPFRQLNFFSVSTPRSLNAPLFASPMAGPSDDHIMTTTPLHFLMPTGVGVSLHIPSRLLP
jgi:hypothetical protein